MVAGKMRAAMGFQKSPSTPKTDSSSSSKTSSNSNSNSNSNSKTVFSRSLGVYFPKSSSQIQPRPPDVSDLLKIINDLQEKESKLRVELLEHKLLKETVAIVPFLENQIASNNAEIQKLKEEAKLKDQNIKNLELLLNQMKTKEEEEEESSRKVTSCTTPSSYSATSSHPELSASQMETKEEARGANANQMIISCTASSCSSETSESSPPPPPPPPPRRCKNVPPPPPPPPPKKGAVSWGTCVRRVPEVVEFYHSLMRRDSKRESGAGVTDLTSAANARNMIGEIENRSAHLLAIKTDVERHGELIKSLIKEINIAAFTKIEDLVTFVKWIDDKLSFLVDERAVLKHFDWPEHKADAMREAAFGYCDLKKLEKEALNFHNDRKKMQAILEKLEHGVYNLSRVREGAVNKYKGLRIPWEWMMDNGIVCQIKLASVKLAMKYMKQVLSELESLTEGPEEEELMLQGVKFAFRVHQFAGGFDSETMRAFKELRDKACSLQNKKQKVFSRDMPLSC